MSGSCGSDHRGWLFSSRIGGRSWNFGDGVAMFVHEDSLEMWENDFLGQFTTDSEINEEQCVTNGEVEHDDEQQPF